MASNTVFLSGDGGINVMLGWQEIKTLEMSETMIEEDVVGTIYEMQDGGMIYVPSE